MAAGTQDCRSQGSVCIQKRAQVHVIRSFEGWNGFRHIYAWTSTTTKGGIDDIIKSGSSSKFWCQISNTDDTDAGKKLATVACIVRGFKFYGYAEQSLDLALQAFQSVFSLNLVHPGTKRRSKRVKRRNALADITDQMWGMSSISLSWSLGVILEEMCMQDDAWKRFPDVSNVIALRSLDQPAATSQGTIVFPLPLYLCVYFCTVCDEHVDHFYASATAVCCGVVWCFVLLLRCCFVLCCLVLLCCVGLCCFVLSCVVTLCRVVLWCFVGLCCLVVFCWVVLLCCVVLPCVVLCHGCLVLWCVALWCSVVLGCLVLCRLVVFCCVGLSCVVVLCCLVLCCVVLSCGVLLCWVGLSCVVLLCCVALCCVVLGCFVLLCCLVLFYCVVLGCLVLLYCVVLFCCVVLLFVLLCCVVDLGCV